MKQEEFIYGSRKMTVRGAVIGEEWVVRVFEGSAPASGVHYTATTQTVSDAEKYGLDIVGRLMDGAKADFIRWSDLMATKPTSSNQDTT